MSNCAYCGIRLPGAETTCKECFEKQYASVEVPTIPILQRIAAFIRAPLSPEDTLQRPSLIANLLFALGGLFLC
jgi:hypothetical protein